MTKESLADCLILVRPYPARTTNGQVDPIHIERKISGRWGYRVCSLAWRTNNKVVREIGKAFLRGCELVGRTNSRFV
jgi:hypothetical protein